VGGDGEEVAIARQANMSVVGAKRLMKQTFSKFLSEKKLKPSAKN